MQIPDDLKINLKIQFVVTKRVAKAAVDTPLYILRRGSLYHFYVHYEHRRPYLRCGKPFSLRPHQQMRDAR